MRYIHLFLLLQFTSLQVYSACSDPPVAGVNWENCVKRSLILSGEVLRDANLSGTDFMFANLEGADLSGTNLSGSVMLGANLEGVNFENANLTSSFMTKAKIAGANFKGSVLDGAIWVNGQKCSTNSVGKCK